MFARMHAQTEHPAFLPFLVLPLCQLPKCQTPAHVGTPPSNNTGFRRKLYKVPPGCSLYCDTQSHSMKHQAWRGSVLWTQAPSQGTIPLVPCSETGSPGNAGNISPGRQSSTDGQCVFPLPVPADHPFTTPVLHCLGGRQDHPAGQVRSMAQVFREAAAPVFGTGS